MEACLEAAKVRQHVWNTTCIMCIQVLLTRVGIVLVVVNVGPGLLDLWKNNKIILN